MIFDDTFPNEVQGLLDRALRRGLPDSIVAASPTTTVMASRVDGAETDLVVAVHDRRHRSFDQMYVSIADSVGSLVRAPFTSRGQAMLRGVGPAPWRARVIRAAKSAPPLPILEINRHLPLAAAVGERELDFVARDASGRVSVSLHEDDERHLQVSIAGVLPDNHLARLRWLAVGRHHQVAGTLVTPVPWDGPAEVGYDLGPLGDTTTVEVFPIEVVSAEQLERADVEATLECGWRGAARRAWRTWLGTATVDAETRALLAPLTR